MMSKYYLMAAISLEHSETL